MLDAIRKFTFRHSRRSQTESNREASPDNYSPRDITARSFTGRIAAWSAKHRWWVLAASVLVLVMAIFVSGAVATKLLDESEIGEGESGVAGRLLEERFDEGGAPTEQLVFSHPSLGVDDPVYPGEDDGPCQDPLGDGDPDAAAAVGPRPGLRCRQRPLRGEAAEPAGATAYAD